MREHKTALVLSVIAKIHKPTTLITKKYKNPPLVEAVFELFYQSSDWTPMAPLLFYSEIKDEHPVLAPTKSGFGFMVNTGGVHMTPESDNMYQFRNEKGNSIIQLTSNLFTVNSLPEYRGWENYKYVITESLKKLKKIIKLNNINRIGLKVINKVDIGSHTVTDFKKYFNIFPNSPDGLLDGSSSINMNVEVPLGNNDYFVFEATTIRAEIGYKAPVMFQLYYTRIGDIIHDDIEQWIEDAHGYLHTAFQTVMTEQSKLLFDNE